MKQAGGGTMPLACFLFYFNVHKKQKGCSMRILKIMFLFSSMVGLAACATMMVNYDYDKNTNFSGFKSYDWHSIPRSVEMNDLVINRIKDAVNRELQAKGFRQVAEKPDFLIAVHTSRQQKLEVIDWGYTYGPYWRRGFGYGGVDVRQYEEGTLILDVIDAVKKELVWRGTATGIIDPYQSPEKRTEKINEAVKKILGKFPPSA
jgi:hypothetical protein